MEDAQAHDLVRLLCLYFDTYWLESEPPSRMTVADVADLAESMEPGTMLARDTSLDRDALALYG